jgi:hypothetical protein
VSTEIAGLPVRTEPEGLMTPLAAVAVIRGLDQTGALRYWHVQTADVTTVEAIGMHVSAAELHKSKLTR